MLLAIGGDGTILRAIHWMVKGCGTRAPILGVNVGRIGFLSETDLSSLESAMTRIIEGNYNIETYMMLECTVKDKSFMCVNVLYYIKNASLQWLTLICALTEWMLEAYTAMV